MFTSGLKGITMKPRTFCSSTFSFVLTTSLLTCPRRDDERLRNSRKMERGKLSFYAILSYARYPRTDVPTYRCVQLQNNVPMCRRVNVPMYPCIAVSTDRCVWGAMCPRIHVSTHRCVQSQMCSRTDVSTYRCIHVLMCPRTDVSTDRCI